MTSLESTNLLADPLEQHNLFDDEPEIVSKLLMKINRAKRNSVQSAYSPPLPPDSSNTLPLDGVLVPKPGYCDPAVDFPLIPQNSSCLSTV